MLNKDDSKSAGPSVAALINDPPPRNPTPATPISAPQDGTARNGAVDDTSLPRKRQRVGDPPSPSSVALASAPPSKPAPAVPGPSGRQTPTASVVGVSPQQVHKALPRPDSRNNSVSAASETSDVLEPSIVNMKPSEELTRFVSDFIFLSLDNEEYENLEVCLLGVD